MTGIPSASCPADRGGPHDPHFVYHRFRKGGFWRCSCGANGETTGSPAVGWAGHVAAVTRNNDNEGDV